MHTDLAHAILSPSFTPRVRDCDAVIELLLRGKATEAAVTVALLRVGKPAILALQSALVRSSVAQRTELVAILGRLLIDTGSEPAPLLALFGDTDRKVARAAVIAAGKLPSPQPIVEAELLRLWPSWTAAPDRRALAEALGKIGGSAALAVLDSADAEPGSVLATALAQAKQRLGRTALRSQQVSESQRILSTVALGQPVPIVLKVRAGLESLLLTELAELPVQPIHIERSETLSEPSRITIRWSKSLAELWRLRTFSSLAFALPSLAFDLDDIRLPRAVAAALAEPGVLSLLSSLTVGDVRYRLELAGTGPRRAFLRELVTAIAERAPSLCNDSMDSPWQLELRTCPDRTIGLELFPKQLVDPRFVYRQQTVPAASHPTLAAALARTLAATPRDVVWDPFVGSGGELCEVFLRCPTARLFGSDVDAAALAATQQNTRAVGAAVELRQGDSLSLWPPSVTCVVTNPPMGRRVCRGDLVPLLERFVVHVGRSLPRGGKLCWLNPIAKQISLLAEDQGLRRVVAQPVDMNGFWAQLELWVRR